MGNIQVVFTLSDRRDNKYSRFATDFSHPHAFRGEGDGSNTG